MSQLFFIFWICTNILVFRNFSGCRRPIFKCFYIIRFGFPLAFQRHIPIVLLQNSRSFGENKTQSLKRWQPNLTKSWEKERKKECSVLFKECSVLFKERNVIFSIYICLYISRKKNGTFSHSFCKRTKRSIVSALLTLEKGFFS